MMIKLGVTDLPKSAEEKDLLKITKYAEGLCQFIEKCNTPMSIALQGDWGSGKTSLLNYIEHKLHSNNKIKTISINTWQYSQMKKGDSLSAVFILSLLDKMDVKSKLKDNFGKRILKFAGKLAVSAVGADGRAIDELDECIDDIKLVEKLREEFASEVSKYIEDQDGRLVILVDDLDRLNPDVAVELLEVIKLFMDVDKCIFVLAIDYDVVVLGVKSKYGQSITTEKCRSFFDKIIQLPFHMPVEKYELASMIEEFLGKELKKEHLGEVSKFAEYAIGANPRATKRITNSFVLLKIINDNLIDSGGESTIFTKPDYALLFCVLCIQVKHSLLYKYLSKIKDWQGNNKNDLFSLEVDIDNTDKDDETIKTEQQKLREVLIPYAEDKRKDESLNDEGLSVQLIIIAKLCELLRALYFDGNDIETAEDKKVMYENLSKVINLSSVTNRENAKAGAQKTYFQGDFVTIRINGKEYKCEAAREAYVLAANEILAEYPEQVNDCVDKLNRFLSTNPEKSTSRDFLQGKRVNELKGVYYTDKNGNKKTIYIGTKSDTPEKRKKLKSLLKLVGAEGSIVWIDGSGTYKL